MCVPLTKRDGTIEPGNPFELFQTLIVEPTLVLFQYDVSPDGEEFLINSLPRGGAAAPLSLLVNWEESGDRGWGTRVSGFGVRDLERATCGGGRFLESRNPESRPYEAAEGIDDHDHQRVQRSPGEDGHVARRTRLRFPIRHRSEELRVPLRLRHLGQQQLHRLDRRQRREHLAQHPHAVQILARASSSSFRVPLFWTRAG
jgi:hypothetical protein